MPNPTPKPTAEERKPHPNVHDQTVIFNEAKRQAFEEAAEYSDNVDAFGRDGVTVAVKIGNWCRARALAKPEEQADG